MPTSSTTRSPSSRSALIRIGGLATLLIVASLIAYRTGWFNYNHTLEHIERVRQSHSMATFVVGFIFIYGVGTAVGLPGLPFTVAAGVLFGTILGTVLSWAGALLGAGLGYWLAHTVAHDQVLRWVRRFPRVD